MVRPFHGILISSLLALLLVGSAADTAGQTASVRGLITVGPGEPAAGATVFLAGTTLGTAAGEDGRFLLRPIPAGFYEIQVRLVGYTQEEAVRVSVRAGEEAEVTIRLRQVDIELNQVVVTGTRRQNADDVRPSITRLEPRESKYLPGAAEDVLRSLQALPGVTSVNDFSSQLVVRGSGPDQNLIMIDGFEVLNPYRLYGFVSMFNPETLSDISLQTGGFGAEYGDRLSAVLDVRNRDGRTDVLSAGKINTSLTNMNAVVEGGLPVGGVSYLVSARRTYYDLILGPILRSAKLVEGDVALPNFRDLQAKVTWPVSSSNQLGLSFFTSRDGVELVSGAERDRPDSVTIFDRSFNTLAGVTWQYNPSRSFLARTQVSWYRNDGAGVFDGTFVDPAQNTGDLGRADTLGIRFFKFGVDYDYVYTKTTLNQRALWNSGSHSLTFGWGVDVLRTDLIRSFELDPGFRDFLRSLGLVVPTDITESVSYNRWNAFLQDKISVGDRFFIQPGLRVDVYPSLLKQVYLSPRLQMSFRLDDLTTLRAAYGQYYQSPGMEKQDFRARVVFTRDYLAALTAETADHYILGFDRMLSPEWQLKVEGYYKRFRSVIVPEKLQGTLWSTARTGGDVFSPTGWTTPVLVPGDSLTARPVNDATGSSYGFEILFQKVRSLPEDRFTGWAGYALSSAERDRDGTRTPFLFDQRHAVNLVGNYRFAERWDIGLRFTLRSGRPFSQALDVKPRIMVQSVGGVTSPVLQRDSNGRVILDVLYERDAYTGRLNLYHTLDLRITTYPRWWGLDWSVYLDVQNVYNHSNEQQVRYFVGEDGSLNRRGVYGIPIFPSLGMSLTF
jgi:hypothetical protein